MTEDVKTAMRLKWINTPPMTGKAPETIVKQAHLCMSFFDRLGHTNDITKMLYQAMPVFRAFALLYKIAENFC